MNKELHVDVMSLQEKSFSMKNIANLTYLNIPISINIWVRTHKCQVTVVSLDSISNGFGIAETVTGGGLSLYTVSLQPVRPVFI